MSAAPVTPCAAAIAAITPEAAACPPCRALVMDSERNACCSPAAKLAAVASALRMTVASPGASRKAAAAALPNVPTVPVVWKWR